MKPSVKYSVLYFAERRLVFIVQLMMKADCDTARTAGQVRESQVLERENIRVMLDDLVM